MSIKRRQFITVLGGAAAWPLAARAQQPQRMRHIGVLVVGPESDPVRQSHIAAFRQALEQLGWFEGRNLLIDFRWSGGDDESARKYAVELVALAPDVVVAGTGPIARDLQQASRSVPIVFAGANDPVGAGLVESLARPGGNVTGFSGIEYAESGKFLELLKEIAPRVTRAAVIRDPTSPGGTGNLGAIQIAAASLRLEVRPVDSRDTGAIERGITAFAVGPNGGLIVPPSALATKFRELLIKLAARHRLPAVYAARAFVADGGLLSYGPDLSDMYRRAAGYVDRILKGDKPAELPVQAPIKYETAINLKTAKALGITVPPSLLARADEVFE